MIPTSNETTLFALRCAKLLRPLGLDIKFYIYFCQHFIYMNEYLEDTIDFTNVELSL